MLKTKVILSHVTNLSDARYAAGMGVDFIGFSINPTSKYFVTDSDVNTIRDWLSGVGIIGEVIEKKDAENYKIDYEQINSTYSLDAFDQPILKIKVDDTNISNINTILSSYSQQVPFFILDLSGLEWTEHKAELETACNNNECYISAEFTPDNINEYLTLSPEGIVLYGSQEAKPGLSNYDGIADILEVLDED
jgi:phosphoribosylanthranilate isomerase